MPRHRKKRVSQQSVDCEIIALSHEGRGVSKHSGKTQFIEGALPGERVRARFLTQKSRFDELVTVEVLQPSADRVAEPCQHAQACGGCSLQHMDSQAQIRFKQTVLEEQFHHFGGLSPQEWSEPVTGNALGYRSKARLGVRYLRKQDRLIIGFREKNSRNLTDIQRCEVLHPKVGRSLDALRSLVASLSDLDAVSHVEIAMGDDDAAIVLRHLKPFSEDDHRKLIAYAKRSELAIYLQPDGVDSVQKLWPEATAARLHYELPVPNPTKGGDAVSIAFHPSDFTQVNADINRKMVSRALEWLDIQSTDRVLDLFCGLGNFTIPLATQAAKVVGVEGDDSMVLRGKENAELNFCKNVSFFSANLQADFTREAWAKEGFDKILIDPPRSGALDVVNYLAKFKAKRVVYISCNPATLARDAGVLVDKGYRMMKACVMDMFPHTTHVESMALFEKR